jgi:predicted kinase
MEIRTKVHTIFMLVGATECGKTTFAKEILIPQLQYEDESKNFKTNIQYLSSDQIRQDILGYDYDKYDQVMLEASDQAFHILFEKLKAVTSFPVNAEFVIVDTTGLSEEFRARIRDIAFENNYNIEVILFDYKRREDYYASERSKKLITSHLSRLRKEVLGSLAKEKYTKIHKIREKNFILPDTGRANTDYQIIVEDIDAYLSNILSHEYNYIVIGDVHECVEELKGLIKSYGFKLDEQDRILRSERTQNMKFLLVGDWIDKGNHTKKIIDFLYANRKDFVFVLGNHENFVYKYIHGDITDVDEEILHTYFHSTRLLLSDPALTEKFNALCSESKPYTRFIGKKSPSFYVTHAPCKNKYIGKMDKNSIRNQRNFRLDRSKPLEEQLVFLKEEAVNNHPYHVFGHVAVKRTMKLKNKINIDTGCVQGNELTSVSLDSWKLYFKRQNSQSAFDSEELQELFKEERKVSIHDLGDEEIRRLKFCSSYKINFISGTMSPADKDEESNQLESLETGLHYFLSKGIHEVVLQPKYMGSRCNIYLHRDVQQFFAVSRNGYKINHLDLSGVYGKLLEKFGVYMQDNQISTIILDGELLPWRALGEGLIERQFKTIERALDTEIQFLKNHGFEAALDQLVTGYKESGFEKDQFHVSKKELNEKYGNGVYQNYKYLSEAAAARVKLDEHEAAFSKYKEQIDIYGSEGEVEFKPFSILKMIYENGEEQVLEWGTSEIYQFVSDDAFLLLDLNESSSFAQAREYFQTLTVDQKMEGVVIKPERAPDHAVPFMKVRNPDYLTIIYGYDYQFPHKYKKLMKQKNISAKLRTSLNEHRLGREMLSYKLDEISPSNAAYVQTVANLLFEVSKEKEMDPRL